jgi:hypothetical protein
VEIYKSLQKEILLKMGEFNLWRERVITAVIDNIFTTSVLVFECNVDLVTGKDCLKSRNIHLL